MNTFLFLALYIPGWMMFLGAILMAGESARREFPELGIEFAPTRSIGCAFIWPLVVLMIFVWAMFVVAKKKLMGRVE